MGEAQVKARFMKLPGVSPRAQAIELDSASLST